MKLRSAETYWLLKNGMMNNYPTLQQDIACEILVIGGGITGALMAFQFSSEGYNTVLVDRRDIALGSTSASTSMLQYEVDEPLYSLIQKVGENVAVDTYAAGVTAISKLRDLVNNLRIDCKFEMKQSLYIANSTRDGDSLYREFECRDRYGLNVQWLTGHQLERQFGVNGRSAILSATGASLDVYKLAHSLLQYAIKHQGLRVYDHTSIKTTISQGNLNIASTENSLEIEFRYVVYATGYETQAFLKDKIVDLISTYACVSEPLTNLPGAISNTLFWNTEDPYLYFRSTGDNRIIVGGEDASFSDSLRRDALLGQKEAALTRKFRKLMPDVGFVPDMSWAGTFGVTKDALPYIGVHPDFPNSYFVLGFGGNGITFSVMGMEIISDAISGKKNRFLEYYKFKR